MVEHGFYYSEIDLGKALSKGHRFVNVYEARLQDLSPQQLSIGPNNFPLRPSFNLTIHFPAARPPLNYQTSIIEERLKRPMCGAGRNRRARRLKITRVGYSRTRFQNIFKLSWKLVTLGLERDLINSLL